MRLQETLKGEPAKQLAEMFPPFGPGFPRTTIDHLEDTDMAILSSKGVKPEMKFVCCDCTEIISGQRVIEGEHLHIVAANRVEPEKSEFRCECCQDDWEEKFG